MALVECPECKKEISSASDRCPICGYKQPSKGITRNGFIAILIVILIIGTAVTENKDNETTSRKASPQSRTDLIGEAFHFWDGSHINVEKLVKDNLKDPDSYEHIETTYVDHGDFLLVNTKYRAKNGFGGYVIERIIAKCKVDGTIIEVVFQG